MKSDTYSLGPREGTVVDSAGKIQTVPAGWCLLPPGDAAVTRRVKAAGAFWQVQEKKGRRTFSKGIYAPAETIASVQATLDEQRATPAYARRREADTRRRAEAQADYEVDFEHAVRDYLAFDPAHEAISNQLAAAVARHATPVGSGTVARTKRIPIEQRAEAAVIAWMRHQTTAYDNMKIERVKGRRREVRRQLAQKSKALLARYRQGLEVAEDCPLQLALSNTSSADELGS